MKKTTPTQPPIKTLHHSGSGVGLYAILFVIALVLLILYLSS